MRRDNRKYTVNDNFLKEVGPEQAYFIGLMAADGSIAKSPKAKQNKFRYLKLSQSGYNGLKTIKYITNLLESDCKIYSDPKISSHSFQITSISIVSELIKIGVTPNKTLTLGWPKISPLLSNHFMRGYIDGDGSVGIYKRGGGTYLSLSYVGTEEFVKSSILFLPVNKYHLRKVKRCKNLYQIYFNGQAAEIMCKWLWIDSKYKSYKYDIYNNWMTNYHPPYRKYTKLKHQAKKLFDSGMTPVKISKEINIAFQTVYKWRKEWI